MYYDDQARPFNLLSGFIFGALLAAGLTVLARASQEEVPLAIGRRARGR
jgi:hypothetical protein